MARIKGGLNAKKKHNRVLKLAKGYRGARSKQYRVAKQSVMRAPKSFEDGMARLETILSQMQSEETTLTESVKLYAEAASLMEYCHAALEKASLQMEEIDAARSEKAEAEPKES